MTERSTIVTPGLVDFPLANPPLKPEEENAPFKTEDEIPQSSVTPTLSFSGRLNISDFAFTPPRTSTLMENVTPSPRLKRKSTTLTATTFRKKSRSPSGYAPPSTYAHLSPLPDRLALNLICVFVGLNPGIQTATSGHAYAHPSNLFWKLLHSSGCTPRRCQPSEDQDLPALFALGNTNIVSRPTRNGSELSKEEMDESVWELEEKVRRWRPESVCIVGKSIWESLWRVRHGRGIKKDEFRYGWQDEEENMGATPKTDRVKDGSESGGGLSGNDSTIKEWKGAKVFVATSTSGLAASLLPAEKERIWRELGVWVEQRRKERGG